MVAVTTPSSPKEAAGPNAHPTTPLSVIALVETLVSSLSSARSSLPITSNETTSKAGTDGVTIVPPRDGISLLDTKSELLLSYLHHLVFLILFQLRERSAKGPHSEDFAQDVVKKLVELRAYLDRGVKPLEARLKYQIDKVVRAAEDAERSQKGNPSESKESKRTKKGLKTAPDNQEHSELVSDEEDEAGADEDDEEEDEEDEIDEMAYRPNISAFTHNRASSGDRIQSGQKEAMKSSSAKTDGIYRPPKIKPTAPPTSLPTTDHDHPNRRDRERRPQKSSVIDEFVTAEMSSAPMAEPSIGSTIQRGGRRTISHQEREKEHARRVYEETNFVRLPKESKKERAKQRRLAGGRDGGFGGEEFRMLSEGADRIGRLTGRLSGRRSTGASALDRSRKRRLTEDSPRGDGTNGIGESFEKRRKRVERKG